MHHQKHIQVLVCLTIWAALFAPGCRDISREIAPEWHEFSQTSLGQTASQRAMAASTRVMRAQFRNVQTRSELMMVTAQPAPFKNRQIAPGGQQLRRRAQLHLQRRNDQLWAYLQVRLERLDLVDRSGRAIQTVRPPYQDTAPLESSDKEIWSQQENWTVLRRDRDLESNLLARLRSELGIYARDERPDQPAAE